MKWESKVKHVGNIINCSLKDEDDICYKKQCFFIQVNKLLANYQGVMCNILSQLFSKYCSSFYGSQLWDLRSKDINSLYKSWNRAVRRVFTLPYNSHCYFLPLLLQVPSLEVQLCQRFINFCRKMYYNRNEVVSYMCRNGLKRSTSILSRNLYIICKRFNCNVTQLLQGYTVKQSFSHDEIAICEHLRELLYARDRVMTVEGFSSLELQVMINALSTL